jgi:FMN reductase
MQEITVRNAKPFIVGIGGTARPGSSSERALRIALAAAESEGAEVACVTGKELVMPLYDPTCTARTSEARRFVELVRDCDGVIISSPAYHGSMSGLIKNALDYTEDLRDADPPYLDRRAVGCIACASGWQGTGPTLMALRAVVHALRGWPTPMGAMINSALPVFDSTGQCIEDSVRFQLQTIGSQVVRFAQQVSLRRTGAAAPGMLRRVTA